MKSHNGKFSQLRMEYEPQNMPAIETDTFFLKKYNYFLKANDRLLNVFNDILFYKARKTVKQRLKLHFGDVYLM